MESYKKTIADIFATGNQNLTEDQHRVFNKISDGIDYAWNNWDKEIIAEFHTGTEKPNFPTQEFIEDWLDTQDFEADGYDVEGLKELFG